MKFEQAVQYTQAAQILRMIPGGFFITENASVNKKVTLPIHRQGL
ncbi:hypothetical protein [Paenibacillus polymyxa]|nr:hypothetical protein [Paenibacillus polymyxa]